MTGAVIGERNDMWRNVHVIEFVIDRPFIFCLSIEIELLGVINHYLFIIIPRSEFACTVVYNVHCGNRKTI
jgi:hypothetical protein